MTAQRIRPTRLLALIAIGPAFLLLLAVAAYFRYTSATSGLASWLGQSFGYKPIKAFGIHYALRILLPLYFGAGIAAWALTLGAGLLARRDWYRAWRGREALGFGLSALLWVHLVLWWQVPSTLWTIPILRNLPFFLLFPLLALLTLAYPCYWLWTQTHFWRRRMTVLGLWLLAWSSMALAPQILPRPLPDAKGGTQPCRVLMLGVDGLRSDVFLAQAHPFKGIPYRNAYTPIPATRMLWHILWGGDPMVYTIGHVAPAREEFLQPQGLSLLKEATDKGMKPRFYIDDGGTIGLAGRPMYLDDALMPALGWENFVNSNLASSFPLYAVWENWFKPFPTTNPWARMDAGLKESLRLGRGSGWVMFHSCLAHQPIFLTQNELWQIKKWWQLSPKRLEPLSHILQVKKSDITQYDSRINPFTAYNIRMNSILHAWLPIWNNLDQDPFYKGAVRVLFSDHGERFHNVSNGFQLQGVHGFNLDPWECRASMMISGPGFSNDSGLQPREITTSLLGIRDGIREILEGRTFDCAFFENSHPKAPIRYHSVGTSAFGPDPLPFKVEPEKGLAVNTYLAPNGIWFTEYSRTAEERAQDASVAYGEGENLYTFKPLQQGGAQKCHYKNYSLVSETTISESDFRKQKKAIEMLF